MRVVLNRISPLLLASVLAGGFVVSSTLPAGAEPREERRDRLHAERPVAAPTQIPAFVDPDIAAQVALAEAEAEWIAAIVRAEAEAATAAAAAAEAAAARRSSGGSTVTVSRGSCSGDVDCFLECTRDIESTDNYGLVSSGGTYRGAYQFVQPTWDAAVAGAGHAEYSGMPAEEAPPEVQDAAAAHLYSVSGNRPWGGRC